MSCCFAQGGNTTHPETVTRNVFIPQFEHITNSRISKLPGLRSETPVTMHACTLLFSPPTGQRMKSADFYCDTEMGHIVLLAKILPF